MLQCALCDHRNKQRSLLFHDVCIALVDLAGLHVAMPSFSMDGWFVIVRQSYSHSNETKVFLFMQFITICCWCVVNSTKSRLCESTNNKTKNCSANKLRAQCESIVTELVPNLVRKIITRSQQPAVLSITI